MIENLGDLAKAAGIKEDILKEALASEEAVKIELNQERVVYDSKEDFETYVNNVSKEKSKAALEIAVKEKRNELGLDFEGKTIDNLVKAIKDKTLEEAKIEPNEKVRKYEEDLTKLRQLVTEKEEALTTIESRYKKESQERSINDQVLNSLPKEGTIIGQDELLTLFKSKYEITLDDDGKMVVLQNGEVLKDNLMNPKDVKEVVTEFSSSYVKKPDGGRGKGNEGGNPKDGTMDSFLKEMSDKNITGSALNHEMNKRISEGTLSV